MPNCIICGKIIVGINDTCSGKCYIKALSKEKKEAWHGTKQLTINNYDI